VVDHLNAYVSTPGLFKNSLCLTSSKWVLSTFFRASEGEGSVEKVWRPTSVTPLPPRLHRCHLGYTAATSVTPLPPRLHRCHLSYTAATSVTPLPPQLHRCHLSYTVATSVTPLPPQLHRCQGGLAL